MKKIIFLTLGVAVIVAISLTKSAKYEPRKATKISPEEGVAGAIDYFRKIRFNQITGTLDLADVERARDAVNAAAQNRSQSAINLAWEEMGPDNVGGRTRALMMDKDSTEVIYAGGVAGGLWKSVNGGQTWRILFDKFEANTVSCITQAINGDIYVGTGEGHYSLGQSNGQGAGGMIGSGIWKSTNRGASWTRLASTIPTSLNSYTTAFSFVNEVATSPSNPQRIYASTNGGLRMSDNGGLSWINPIHTPDSSQASGDVHVGIDGTVLGSLAGKAYRSPNGDDNSFILVSSVASGKLPLSGVSRLEFAFSPQDPNYVYCCAAATDGSLYGVYQSINKGLFWTNIASVSANPLGGQGTYDNTIVVSSSNKNKIFVGGVVLYMCNAAGNPIPTWDRIGDYSGNFVHSDLHAFVSHPTNGNILYISCDGGIYKTLDANSTAADGPIFFNVNKGYNITQFYGIAPTANGDVVGGTQDNGTKHIITQGGFSQSASTIGGGDGGYTEASFLLPTTYFSTVYYGALARTFGSSGSGTSFYSPRIESLPGYGDPGFASFITPISLWESFHDTTTPDSVSYTIKATDALQAGGVLKISSNISSPLSTDKFYLYDTNKVARTVGEIIKVQDYLQSHIAVGFNNSVWFSKDAINQSGQTRWMRIGADLGSSSPIRYFGEAKILRFSADGDYLYVGTFSGNLFRFSNLKSINRADTLTGEIGNPACQIDCKKIASFPGRALCGIGIDPNNNDKIIITLGNYGSSNYVYKTLNATSAAPSFTLLQSNLPPMPVYDALIDMNNSNNILLGTEYGIWASDNDGLNWTQSTSLPYIPVLCLRQQLYAPSATVSHTGVIYAGTHGRGVFKTNSLVGINNNFLPVSKRETTVTVTPNPAKDKATVSFYVQNTTAATLKIYSLAGKLLRSIALADLISGKNDYPISLADFEAGTYLVSIISGSKQTNAKFVVIK